jgi:hypothetical protein
MSKLGFVIIEGWTEALKWCVKNKPTAVEFMLTGTVDKGRIALVRELIQASPKTLLVIRAYPDDHDHPDFQDRMLKWSEPLRKVSNRVVAHSVNEPVVFNANDAKRLNDYEIGFIERMTAEGLIPMCFCLSESHLVGPTLDKDGNFVDWGNLPLWEHMASGVRKLAETGGFLGFNEYDWPNWNSSRDKGLKWRLGHWELNLDWIARFVPRLPQVGIGEGVLDGKIWTSRLPRDDPRYDKPWGWRKIKSPQDHLADIAAIEKESYNQADIAFNLLFAWAPGHRDWDAYDVSIIADILANHLLANPPIYWEPKEESMEIPAWLNDVRETLPKHSTKRYSRRSLDSIDTIVVHHTATTSATPEGIARWHVEKNGWPGAGYHLYIRKSGKAYLMNGLDVVSSHCYNHNEHTLGLAFEGDFTKESATGDQIDVGRKAVAWLEAQVGKSLNVKDHKSMPDNQTACPGEFPVVSLSAQTRPSELEILLKKYDDLRQVAIAARNTLDAALED